METKSALKVFILFTFAAFVAGQCTGANTTSVVKMCELNIRNGQSVSLDTSGAAATVNIPGVMCRCTAVIRNAKAIQISSTGPSGTCGSRVLSNTTSGEIFNTGQDCSGENGPLISVSYPEALVDVQFIKEDLPYATDFCITFSLVLCEEGQFQCNDGKCISDSDVGNSFPDCVGGEDELDEGSSCSEGFVQCDDGGCIPPDRLCDGVKDCEDNSDETRACGNSTITTPIPVPIQPVIELTCFETEHLSTTTTTTTTPTTTTTTTTTPTTTTTTTTTTSTTTTTTTSTTTTSTTPTTTPTTTTATTVTTPWPTVTTEKTTPTTVTTPSPTVTTEKTTPKTRTTIRVVKDTTSPQTEHTIKSLSEDDGTSEQGTASPLQRNILIGAAVIGAVVLITIVTAIACYVSRKKKRQRAVLNAHEMWIPTQEDPAETQSLKA